MSTFALPSHLYCHEKGASTLSTPLHSTVGGCRLAVDALGAILDGIADGLDVFAGTRDGVAGDKREAARNSEQRENLTNHHLSPDLINARDDRVIRRAR